MNQLVDLDQLLNTFQDLQTNSSALIKSKKSRCASLTLSVKPYPIVRDLSPPPQSSKYKVAESTDESVLLHNYIKSPLLSSIFTMDKNQNNAIYEPVSHISYACSLNKLEHVPFSEKHVITSCYSNSLPNISIVTQESKLIPLDLTFSKVVNKDNCCLRRISIPNSDVSHNSEYDHKSIPTHFKIIDSPIGTKTPIYLPNFSTPISDYYLNSQTTVYKPSTISFDFSSKQHEKKDSCTIQAIYTVPEVYSPNTNALINEQRNYGSIQSLMFNPSQVETENVQLLYKVSAPLSKSLPDFKTVINTLETHKSKNVPMNNIQIKLPSEEINLNSRIFDFFPASVDNSDIIQGKDQQSTLLQSDVTTVNASYNDSNICKSMPIYNAESVAVYKSDHIDKHDNQGCASRLLNSICNTPKNVPGNASHFNDFHDVASHASRKSLNKHVTQDIILSPMFDNPICREPQQSHFDDRQFSLSDNISKTKPVSDISPEPLIKPFGNSFSSNVQHYNNDNKKHLHFSEKQLAKQNIHKSILNDSLSQHSDNVQSVKVHKSVARINENLKVVLENTSSETSSNSQLENMQQAQEKEHNINGLIDSQCEYTNANDDLHFVIDALHHNLEISTKIAVTSLHEIFMTDIEIETSQEKEMTKKFAKNKPNTYIASETMLQPSENFLFLNVENRNVENKQMQLFSEKELEQETNLQNLLGDTSLQLDQNTHSQIDNSDTIVDSNLNEKQENLNESHFSTSQFGIQQHSKDKKCNKNVSSTEMSVESYSSLHVTAVEYLDCRENSYQVEKKEIESSPSLITNPSFKTPKTTHKSSDAISLHSTSSVGQFMVNSSVSILNPLPIIETAKFSSIVTEDTSRFQSNIHEDDQPIVDEIAETIDPDAAIPSANNEEDSNISSDNEGTAWHCRLLVSELGVKEPPWVDDNASRCCMSCGLKFTVWRRRHHCRTCGRLLCSVCTQNRIELPFLPLRSTIAPPGTLLSPPPPTSGNSIMKLVVGQSHRMHRVCADCYKLITNGGQEDVTVIVEHSQQLIPEAALSMQAPSSTLPAIVDPVITQDALPPQPVKRPISNREAISKLCDPCLIPKSSGQGQLWPPLIVEPFTVLTLLPNPPEILLTELFGTRSMQADSPPIGGRVIFAVTRNLHIRVSLVSSTWCFSSNGLYAVGQEEVCMLISRRPEEKLPPLDALWHYYMLYQLAVDRPITTGREIQKSKSPFTEGSCLLQRAPNATGAWFDERWCGFLFIRASLQSLDPNLILPEPPFLFSLLVHPNESAWALHLPLRLQLALGSSCSTTDSYPCPLVCDRDRDPLFRQEDLNDSLLSIFLSSSENITSGLTFVHIPDLVITISSPSISTATEAEHVSETLIQLAFKRSSHALVKRLIGHLSGDSGLLFGFSGDFCPSAAAHLTCARHHLQPQPDTPEDPSQSPKYDTFETKTLFTARGDLISNQKASTTGASFIVFEGGTEEACVSIVEDGCVVRLTAEQFHALTSHMRSGSPLQLRAANQSYNPLFSGIGQVLITVTWVDDDDALDLKIRKNLVAFETSERFSWIDGRPIASRCTYSVPPEQQLRHWLIRHAACYSEETSLTSAKSSMRIVWTHLHNLTNPPVYTVDNRSGEPLDLFAVFRTIAAAFIGAIDSYSDKLRAANQKDAALRVLLQPPNTYLFHIGSPSRKKHTGSFLSADRDGWWRVIEPTTSVLEATNSILPPLIDDPNYISDIDSALISLLDGLVRNITCTFLFKQSPASLAISSPPALELEFDFSILD